MVVKLLSKGASWSSVYIVIFNSAKIIVLLLFSLLFYPNIRSYFPHGFRIKGPASIHGMFIASI